MKKKIQILKSLIDSWQDQSDRGVLTELGTNYLSGLKQAYKILTEK